MAAMGRFVRGCIASLPILWACAGVTQAPSQAAELGKELFAEKAQPPCALCHTLNAASSTGKVGPSLDELKPDLERVRRAVKNGVGNMPPYDETLSDAEIDAVSRYVAAAVGTIN
jgi:sulfite dehydrogenase